MKQVIMFQTPCYRLQPTRTYSRGQVISLLPRESALVCIKVTRHRTEFCPQQTYRPPTATTICYIVKNTTTSLIKFRNSSLHTLLSYQGIQHKFIYLSSKKIVQLHKKWLRGHQVWYPLRKMFVMSQHFLTHKSKL